MMIIFAGSTVCCVASPRVSITRAFFTILVPFRAISHAFRAALPHNQNGHVTIVLTNKASAIQPTVAMPALTSHDRICPRSKSAQACFVSIVLPTHGKKLTPICRSCSSFVISPSLKSSLYVCTLS